MFSAISSISSIGFVNLVVTIKLATVPIPIATITETTRILLYAESNIKLFNKINRIITTKFTIQIVKKSFDLIDLNILFPLI